MIKITGRLKGAEEMKTKTRQVFSRFPRVVAEPALRDELTIDMKESMKRTPVNRGWAKDSHRVVITTKGQQITGDITVGDERTAAYIVALHENLEAFHKTGQAKFLESVILESRPYMGDRLQNRMASYWMRLQP